MANPPKWELKSYTETGTDTERGLDFLQERIQAQARVRIRKRVY